MKDLNSLLPEKKFFCNNCITSSNADSCRRCGSVFNLQENNIRNDVIDEMHQNISRAQSEKLELLQRLDEEELEELIKLKLAERADFQDNYSKLKGIKGQNIPRMPRFGEFLAKAICSKYGTSPKQEEETENLKGEEYNLGFKDALKDNKKREEYAYREGFARRRMQEEVKVTPPKEEVKPLTPKDVVNNINSLMSYAKGLEKAMELDNPPQVESEKELKPCPFCQEDSCYIMTEYDDEFYGLCENCGAEGAKHSTRKGAVKAWQNRRPAVKVDREALAKILYEQRWNRQWLWEDEKNKSTELAWLEKADAIIRFLEGGK